MRGDGRGRGVNGRGLVAKVDRGNRAQRLMAWPVERNEVDRVEICCFAWLDTGLAKVGAQIPIGANHRK